MNDTSTSGTGRGAVGGGLEGVVVADTVLSDVDGERGQLVLRGHRVEELAGRRSFEDVVALLWGLDADVGAALGRARVAAFAELPRVRPALEAKDAMEAIRGAMAALPSGPPSLEEDVRLVAALGVFAAAWARLHAGSEPIAPRADLGHAADYLRSVRGREPADAAVHALDRYLVTVIDHGLNASTFAARVVASTCSDSVSAVVAAIGALKGPLHGGAPGPVLDMLDAIGSAERASAWLAAELAAGRRIMGMGHRVYRVRDPRAAVLERGVRELERSGVSGARGLLAARVEHEAERLLAERHPERRLCANVEFFTAVLLEAVGIPRALFTATFAVSRVAGWCAHVAEQRAGGRLLRPSSRYVGPAPLDHTR